MFVFRNKMHHKLLKKNDIKQEANGPGRSPEQQ